MCTVIFRLFVTFLYQHPLTLQRLFGIYPHLTIENLIHLSYDPSFDIRPENYPKLSLVSVQRYKFNQRYSTKIMGENRCICGTY
jgi:hypothetical protein